MTVDSGAVGVATRHFLHRMPLGTHSHVAHCVILITHTRTVAKRSGGVGGDWIWYTDTAIDFSPPLGQWFPPQRTREPVRSLEWGL